MTLLEIIESRLKEQDQITLTPKDIKAFRHDLKQLRLDKKNPSRLAGLSRIKKEIKSKQLPFTIQSEPKYVHGERVTVWIIKRQQKNVATLQNTVAPIQKNVDITHNFVGIEYLSGKELYEMIDTQMPYDCWLQETITRLQDELNQYQHEQEINQSLANIARWKEMYEPEPVQEEIEPENKCYDTQNLTDDVFESMNMVKFIDNILIESPELKNHFYKFGSNYSMYQIGYDEFIKRWNASTH
ncbi:hypothetical protein [Kurthia massiliensis]|uniref:hypothetical protein n=1 Tax=Kurthia massiliensis TaxID=1033739 RepID=UPI000288B638|nr:hypothetical protein [Kurthia massiliensis]